MKTRSKLSYFLILVLVALGVSVGTHHSSVTHANQWWCAPEFENWDSDDTPGNHQGGGGGGSAPYCPFSEITIGQKTCISIGCRHTDNNPPSVTVCDYREVGTMNRGSCPPLELCK